MWCVAELDEEYIARMEDVLAVYEKPLSAREPVVCIDEKPVVLHEEIRPPLAMQPGRVRGRRLAVESVHRALHPEARQLVKPGGDRDQPVLPAMLGPTPDWRSSFSAEGNTGVEPPHESRPGHDPVELHSQAGSQEVWLQNHAVTVLVPRWLPRQECFPKKSRALF